MVSQLFPALFFLDFFLTNLKRCFFFFATVLFPIVKVLGRIVIASPALLHSSKHMLLGASALYTQLASLYTHGHLEINRVVHWTHMPVELNAHMLFC